MCYYCIQIPRLNLGKNKQKNQQIVNIIMNRKELTAMFKKYGVPVVKTGKLGQEFNELLSMHKRKEVAVTGLKDELYVHIGVVIVDIIYMGHPDTEFPLRLIEKERVGKNGRMACHRSDGVGKKIYIDETPETAAVRCLEEKLGFMGSIDKLKPKRCLDQGYRELSVTLDAKIAGLRVITQKYRFEVVMPDEFYKPQGYEIRRRKTNGDEVTSVFEWIAIHSSRRHKHA